MKDTFAKRGRPGDQAKRSPTTIVKKDMALKKASAASTHNSQIEEVVKIMNRRPQLCSEILDHAVALEEKFKTSVENDVFPRQYYRIRQVGPVLMLQLMQKALPGKTALFWNRIKSAPRASRDMDAVSAAFYIAFAVNSEDHLVGWKPVFAKQMLERYDEFGKRLEGSELDASGFINFKKWGYFSLVYEQQKVAKIRYIGGAEVNAPPSMQDGSEWIVQGNHSLEDAMAKRTGDPCLVPLKQLFDESSFDPALPELEDDAVKTMIEAIEKERAQAAEQACKSMSSKSAGKGGGVPPGAVGGRQL